MVFGRWSLVISFQEAKTVLRVCRVITRIYAFTRVHHDWEGCQLSVKVEYPEFDPLGVDLFTFTLSLPYGTLRYIM
jgi:hypothetical protein